MKIYLERENEKKINKLIFKMKTNIKYNHKEREI